MYKIKPIVLIFAICIFVFLPTVTACVNTNTTYSFANDEYRTDIEPLTNKFPDIGSIDYAYWKVHQFGNSLVPGPSSYKVVAFIIVENLGDLYEESDFDEIQNIIFPEGIDPTITGFSVFNWRQYSSFTNKALCNRFIGNVFVDIDKNLIYIEVENL